LHAVGDGLCSGVGVNDLPKGRFVLVCIHGIEENGAETELRPVVNQAGRTSAGK
jgi:hypothetical protein